MSALVGYRNLADAATVTATASLIGYPITNVQVRQLSATWRANASSNPKIVIDLGTQKSIMLVALLGINAGAFSIGDATIEYSTDGVSWTPDPSVVLPGDGGSPDLPRCLIVRIPPQLLGVKRQTRWIRITPAWNRLGGAPYFEVGRLWISDAIEFPDSIDSAWTLLASDSGSIDDSRGLQVYEDKGSRGRVLRARFPAMKTEQAYGFAETDASAVNAPSVDDLFMAAGKTGEVLFIPRADSPLWIRRTAIYGHLTPDSLALGHLAGNRYSWDATVEEEH